jgi:hypothetical protein
LLTHVLFAWSWIGLGLLAGAAAGLRFADPEWLGGYGSWRRRLVRLGHIAFLGTGLLNLAACWTLASISATGTVAWIVRTGMIGGAVFMPLCCYAAAWRPEWRHAFFVPVSALATAMIALVGALMTAADVLRGAA